MSALSAPVQPAPVALPLDARAILRLLGDNLAGWQVRVIGTVDSTNSALLREARNEPQAFQDPVMLIAEMQTAGRGRAGRVWQAAVGASLTISFGWRLRRPLSELSGLSLVCGLAVHAALLQHGVSTRLKWPNDVLVCDLRGPRKLAGILVETQGMQSGAGQSVTLVVMGIGINLTPEAWANFSASTEPKHALQATDLQTEGARQPPDRNRLAADLALALAPRLARFEKEGFVAFTEEWDAADAFRDQSVLLLDQGRTVCEGTALGVDALGQLRLATTEGQRLIHSGDLSLKPT